MGNGRLVGGNGALEKEKGYHTNYPDIVGYMYNIAMQ